ncbi:DegT/DnrJ/EryC1/StrS family aminotransferase [bacterium]|nr:DegT/DnrJ/EryC1/StrS family aminotransferase [bacterium]MBU1153222.1 DegT/DnrJ/EryC1/StrS family aminotransferase [bacterium]MBU2599419.1 DegT/DnrJ/EryC1/StrS family aminotransferase [bacterium]
MKKLAILGGKPIFKNYLPIAFPSLPPFKEVEDKFKEVFLSGMITNAKYVRSLEEKIANYLNVKYVVCVANCTSGLILSLKALKLKGKVIVPSFTFFATAHTLSWNNLTPTFVDCHRETFNINVSFLEEKIDQETSAIMPVHIFGNPVLVEEINKIAQKYSLKVIYDAAHAFGSRYNNSPLAGYGEVEVFSLSPTKPLVAGEGGVVVTNNKEIAEAITMGRDYGNPGDYHCKMVGLNARMTEVNAITALKNLELFPERLAKRKEIANFYISNLKDIPGISFQKIEVNASSCYKDFAIIIDEERFGLNRDELALVLERENISSRKYFFPPVHKQEIYKSKDIPLEGLENTNFISDHILCLPLFAQMKEEEMLSIGEVIKEAHQNTSLIKEVFKER